MSTDFTPHRGLLVNTKGRPHKNGFHLSFKLKISLSSIFLKAIDDNLGVSPNLAVLASQYKVSRGDNMKGRKGALSVDRVVDQK